jgi:acetyl-CoA carboxylase biotin carboxyl carrier protein
MDMKQIKTLVQEFDVSTLSKLKITLDGFSIELEKNVGVVSAPVMMAAPVAMVAAPATAAADVSSVCVPLSGDAILSPMVGTFYSSPSPDSASFVKVGDRIKKGQVVAILEAMKIMNELEAEFDCEILEILKSDGQAVEYDMPLYSVKKL